MKNKLLKTLLSSGLQAFAVQILSVIFFYILSIYLPKDDFGSIGWANAVSMFLVTLLSFGMEQVVVRRVASSDSSNWAAAAFLFHTFVGSALMLACLSVVGLLVTSEASIYKYLPLYFAAQAFVYMSSPLKQFLNAKEKFSPYAIIALVSNAGKIGILGYCLYLGPVSVKMVGYVLLCFGIIELLSLFIYLIARQNLGFRLSFKFIAYRKLIREALPQYLSVIFDSSLSRIDWILLGVLSTAVVTADYSFAYRAYELIRLPLTVLGPVILVKYSKVLSGSQLSEQKIDETQRFLAIEIFLAVAIVLTANIFWTPAVDAVTSGKYGGANSTIFMVVSCCLPLHFFINLLWTLCFSAKKYRQITKITMLIAVLNLALNLILIPVLGGKGAAIAYLAATFIQALAYYRLTKKALFTVSFKSVVIFFGIGALSFAVGRLATNMYLIHFIISIVLYLTLSFIFKLVKTDDISMLKAYLKK